jgi:hypothetical protein
LVRIMICVAAAPTAVLQALCIKSSRDVTTMALGRLGVEVDTKLQHRNIAARGRRNVRFTAVTVC